MAFFDGIIATYLTFATISTERMDNSSPITPPELNVYPISFKLGMCNVNVFIYSSVNNKMRCEVRMWKTLHFYMVKNSLLHFFLFYSINSFWHLSCPWGHNPGWRKRQRSSIQLRGMALNSEEGIIFHGSHLVSVGGSNSGNCEQEQLNIISECCAV